MPKSVRTPFMQSLAHCKDLTLYKHIVKDVFANIHSSLNPSYSTEIALLNMVKTLTIQDIESAKALAAALDPSYLIRDSTFWNKNHTPRLLKNITVIALGTSLIDTIWDSNKIKQPEIFKVLQSIKSSLAPTHVCVSAPSKRVMKLAEFHEEELLFGKIKYLWKTWNLESLTIHGAWFCDVKNLPSNIKTIKVFFSDCPGSSKGEKHCSRCIDYLQYIVDCIMDMHVNIGEVRPELRGTRLELFNIPHFLAEWINLNAFSGFKIDSEESTVAIDIHGEEKSIRDGFVRSSDCYINNFKVLSKGEVAPCICCGKKI
ncbi:hypothetical protein I302_100101 [Kwoniella bestiolae CBS 10118]|uniref:Uncharacterized protein n=1 Tax=Kwoniella bestiolae CBS 10118 TaxID=1296100 RepID=A0A1B9G476_9TREE|nr:hypothetical protein I302_03475 [Kwoniella bestiolae CBS 10118]OCF25802.1 hypothetical protein I302_03475 [Kwoniella bestiolae CBS 10118]